MDSPEMNIEKDEGDRPLDLMRRLNRAWKKI